MELVERTLAGDRNALARLLTLIETETPEASRAMGMVHLHPENGYYVGVTGPPGSGKSTLVDKLTLAIRERGLSVGIVAVDPSSPFSGGSLLGDRIRMQRHALDPEVFIRSLPSRGSVGGLSRAAKNTARVLSASGRSLCFIETVGAGQVEIDIADAADTTIVVLMPETGDSIQAIKAGILEIADILVVNKADLGDSERLVAYLNQMLGGNQRHDWWRVPVLATQADKCVGVAELLEKVEEHRRALQETGQILFRRQEQRVKELMEIIERRVVGRLMEGRKRDERFSEVVRRVMKGEVDPYSGAMEILNDRDLIQRWLIRLAEGF